jgi:Zn finger protein HypA/HybF involved in hydrogenase expression
MDTFATCTQCHNTFRVSGSQNSETDRTWPVICPHCGGPNEIDFPNAEGVFKVYLS